MPIFRCEECGCIENTACCNYWMRKNEGEPLVCSRCDPVIGEWHGRFSQRSAGGMLIDQNGYLWSQESVDAGQLPAAYRIIGKVPPNAGVTGAELAERPR